ncbi:DUF1679 domain-containing protein [soil metagenome]
MLDWIATATGARAARRGPRIQSLWSGYGEIFRVVLDGGIAPTAIIKHVTPPLTRDSVSDARKRRSYDVEAAFYGGLAPRCDDTCRVARMYASRVTEDDWTFVFEDLDAAGFPGRCDDAEGRSLDACLRWLAAFHARFLGEQPAGLWAMGTYWHLATRLDELAAIADRDLRDRAHDLDDQLAAARFQTILHGDPKEANFCFSRDGVAVAAVDFQYAGRGCAMKDVAYLLHGRDSRRELAALDTYFQALRPLLVSDAAAIEAEWRALYPIARLDFRRFLAGWRG